MIDISTVPYAHNLPAFQVELIGNGSRVCMDGKELKGVRSVKVEQPLDGLPTITVEFVASSVKGIGESK